jgi:hypothetical protein
MAHHVERPSTGGQIVELDPAPGLDDQNAQQPQIRRRDAARHVTLVSAQVRTLRVTFRNRAAVRQLAVVERPDRDEGNVRVTQNDALLTAVISVSAARMASR